MAGKVLKINNISKINNSAIMNKSAENPATTHILSRCKQFKKYFSYNKDILIGLLKIRNKFVFLLLNEGDKKVFSPLSLRKRFIYNGKDIYK